MTTPEDMEDNQYQFVNGFFFKSISQSEVFRGIIPATSRSSVIIYLVGGGLVRFDVYSQQLSKSSI